MDERTESTHERILVSGLQIVSERGLAGVSLGALAGRAGMSKSGLFAHFRSKEDLQVELLRAAEAALRREVAPAMGEPEGLPRLRALFGRWLGWAARSGLPGGCPLYGAAFELDDAEEGPVRDYLTRSKGEWEGMLEGLVGESAALGHMRRDLDVSQFVWRLEGVYLAHHVSWRLMRDPDADARALAAFEGLVAASLPGRSPDSGGSRRTTEQTKEER